MNPGCRISHCPGWPELRRVPWFVPAAWLDTLKVWRYGADEHYARQARTRLRETDMNHASDYREADVMVGTWQAHCLDCGPIGEEQNFADDARDIAAAHADQSDRPLPILVEHYGSTYATAYRAVVDMLPGGNREERHMRGCVAHYFAVLTCHGDLTASDRLTIVACALSYAEQGNNAKVAMAYAAACADCAVTE